MTEAQILALPAKEYSRLLLASDTNTLFYIQEYKTGANAFPVSSRTAVNTRLIYEDSIDSVSDLAAYNVDNIDTGTSIMVPITDTAGQDVGWQLSIWKLVESQPGSGNWTTANDGERFWEKQLEVGQKESRTVSQLPSLASKFTEYWVTDADNPVVGNTVTGGGSDDAKVVKAQSGWIVIATL